ncbi:MAG TPA: hypothetical protein VIF62_12330 [Labilithrix sp.]
MRRAVVFFAASVIALAACSRVAGGKCKGNESLCVDRRNALACQDDLLVQVPCNGPLGCVKLPERGSCDDSLADEGTPCMSTGDEEYACSSDKKKALACKNRKFEKVLDCRGRGGCSLNGQQINCDTSLAQKGDACRGEGNVSCSDDNQLLLVCKDGKFDTYRYCRGPQHCHFRNDVPTCDETLSAEGDPCGIVGQVVCAVDLRNELECRDNVFTHSRSCRKPCQVIPNRPGRPIDCE